MSNYIDNNLQEWFKSLPFELQKVAQAKQPGVMDTLKDLYNRGTGWASEKWKGLEPGTREGIKRVGYGAGAGLIGALGYNMLAPKGKEQPWLNLALPALGAGLNYKFPQIQEYLKKIYNDYRTKPKETTARDFNNIQYPGITTNQRLGIVNQTVR